MRPEDSMGEPVIAKADPSPAQKRSSSTRILLVDDEDRYRTSLAQRLRMRGYKVQDVGDGEEAIRRVRHQRPNVMILDRKMPNMEGEEVLREVKRLAPEVQVIMLTGYASMASAATAGRLDAFAYLEKPCETERLIRTIEDAGREHSYALARHEIPTARGRSLWSWLVGSQNARPGVMMLGALLFAGLFFMPAPQGLLDLLGSPKIGGISDPIAGYSEFRKMAPGQTIASYYGAKAQLEHKTVEADGQVVSQPLAARGAAQKAKIMIGVLVVAALFWATGALPVGFTALLVGVLMYLFGVFPPDQVAKAFAKDAVIFILGVLALAMGLAKTGLDRRIGLLLLGTSKSLPRFAFLFLPMLAVTASFLSEHALVAFLAPILMVVYAGAVRAAGLKRDRALAVMFILSICFVANQGGPGSPAAGGRNAVMIGILADYGMAPSFGEWMTYGMPFVPVMALVIGAYFFLRFRRAIKVTNLDVAAIVRKEAKRIGPMTRDEYVALGVLLLVVVLWISASDALGMGGPAILGLVLLSVFRIMTWKDLSKISWDVVALYAAACAMGVGLATTGAALWMAASFVHILPSWLSSGEGLAVASSLFTGVLTNFMSDGATVSALGPITVPMAQLSGTHPWMIGFSTAFASSFANCLIIGTPNNAIAYALAKDHNTGEQLVTLGDFMRHGVVVTGLAFLVLWGWAIFGYWRWIGF